LFIISLSNLFNAIQATSSLRARIFQSIVRLTERAGAMSAVTPQLTHLDSWMAEWSLDAEQRSELYLQLGLAFKAGGQLEPAFDMRRKYLHAIPESCWPTAKDQIISVIADAIQSPSFFAFEELASIPSVQQLNKESAGQMLNLLVDSSVAEYRAFIRANGDALVSLGLSSDDVLRKMRILTLASIGAERLGVEVPYADIAKALEIDVDEVEIWVIDGK
jgi:translation initiation factor 3 subunit M